MDIDINNYEEYFLLYIDNELSPPERTAVEIFLAENEELNKEFEMLKSTVITPEKELLLSDKSFLFRKEAEWINAENYEEIFILYHDAELTGEQRLETDRFLLTHPEFATEFALLGKVKLEPETDLVFKNKKSLFRKEKYGRVIPLILYRSLVAAVFIGFGFWIFVTQGDKPVIVDQGIARVVQNNTPANNSLNKTPDSLKDPGLQSEELVSITPAKNEKKAPNRKSKGDVDKITEIAAINGNKKAEKSFEKVATDFIEEKTEQTAKTEISKKPIENLEIVTMKADKERLDIAVNNETLKAPAVNVKDASTASYINPEPANDNYIFYNIPADKFKKSKVGVFLKKMKRVVDRHDPLKIIFSAEGKQIAKK